MASAKDHLQNINYTTARSEEHLKGIRDSSASAAQSAAQNTQLLKGIAFTSSASMVFNGITAANTARIARTQEAQLALQREQHALQQAMAEQTARHEFSMWRQTPEGTAFIDWQQRAAALIPLLRDRERTWQTAWANAVGRAQAQTPPDEKQRFVNHPARLKQNGLKIASLASFIVAGLFAIGLIFQMLTASASESFAENNDPDRLTYSACLEMLDTNPILTEADCEAINPAAVSGRVPRSPAGVAPMSS
jgi:hypothetical protein